VGYISPYFPPFSLLLLFDLLMSTKLRHFFCSDRDRIFEVPQQLAFWAYFLPLPLRWTWNLHAIAGWPYLCDATLRFFRAAASIRRLWPF